MAFAFFSVINAGLERAMSSGARRIGSAVSGSVARRTAGVTWDSMAAGAILNTERAVGNTGRGAYNAGRAVYRGSAAVGRGARAAGNAARWMPGGRRLNVFESIENAGRPFQLNFALQRRAMGAVAGAGAVAGLYSGATNSSKGIPAAMSPNGNLEVTQPMDATGDLTLALHKRNKR